MQIKESKKKERKKKKTKNFLEAYKRASSCQKTLKILLLM